ncbi:phage protease [Nakamurella sp. PAMC28650]|uniref:phage protease n=1 Tax=Nakamurella sp. PAMC28650 TaxID=2762325 RepID=UPI00164E1037|nr:phage protease [Nakamurella sp. PAMC28650]QNK82590.1 hypothetical protein H7F38_07750 [Nakamurella sp. PAMC28650]
MPDKNIYQLPVSDAHSSIVEMGDGTRRYRKQLVKFGTFVNPNKTGNKMTLDRTWAETIVENFKNKVLNRVPVAEGHPKDSGELLTKTRGDLSALSIEDDGLYGELEIKSPETVKGIEDDLIYDVSVSFDPDYTDKASGAQVGPALLHVGLVNDPYLKGMQPFQSLSDRANVIMLSESKEPIVSKIKNDREFMVQIEFSDGDTTKSVAVAPGEEVEVPDTAAEAVNTQIQEATAPTVTEPTAEEKAAAEKAVTDKAEADAATAKAEADKEVVDNGKSETEKELETTKAALADANKKIALNEAEGRYTALLSDGKIVPAQRDAFISLSTAATSGTISLADNSTTSLNDLLTDLFKAAPKRINFGEEGAAGDEPKKDPWDEQTEEEKAASLALGVTPEEFNEVNATELTKKEEAK